jgi:hypothetical protein
MPSVRPVFHANRRSALYAILSFVVVLTALRAAAPYWIRHRINHKPASASVYHWQVADVDLRLLRGAYDLEDVTLRKEGLSTPIFQAGRMTSTIRFKTLFHGPVTADAEAFQPRLNLYLDPDRRESKKPLDWGKLLHRLTLFRLSGFAIHDGEVRIHDLSASPEVELIAEEVDIEAENLFRGGEDSSEWAGLTAKGLFMGSGRFTLKTRLMPESGSPVFDFDFSLRRMDLKTMNRALRAYTGMAVEKGRLDLDAAAKASGGKYRGRVHSKLHDFALKQAPEKEKGLVKTVQEKVARIAGGILEWKTEKNEAEGKAPPKMDFSGDFPVEVNNAWSMSEYLLKEAFRKGMKP